MKSKELKLDNPFESGHIKNYMLLYGSVVVIMVLFFIAATLFNNVKDFEKKVFTIEINSSKDKGEVKKQTQVVQTKFKLLEVNPQTYSGY